MLPGATVYWTTNTYDGIGRTKAVQAPDLSTSTHLYSGATVTTMPRPTATQPRIERPGRTRVTLWDGSTQVTEMAANALRSDVGGVLGDNGLHGFSILIPWN